MQANLRLVLLTSLTLPLAAQQTIVIPNGMATAEGSTSNAFPWGRGGTGLMHQGIYDSSHFTAGGVNYPILITGLSWRSDQNRTSLASSYLAATVSLSTCPVDVAQASITMASNRGPDFATVYQGPVAWPALAATPGPCPFSIDVPFTTPFLYDPSAGDLNIECDLPIGGFTGTNLQLDVQGTGAQACRVYMSTGYPTGTVRVDQNHGVVVEVVYLPAQGAALATRYGRGCYDLSRSLYETFAGPAAFDLANTSFQALLVGSHYLFVQGGTYVPPSATAQTLALADDAEVTLPLASPFAYPGGTTSSLVVCSNGFVSAGPGNGTSPVPNAPAWLNSTAARWGNWHNYNPALLGSGQVKFEQQAGVAYVTWENVFSASAGTPGSTFQLQFDTNTGFVTYVFGNMGGQGGGHLVGFAASGASRDLGSTDLSTALGGALATSDVDNIGLGLGASARPVLGTSLSLVSSAVPANSPLGATLFGLTEYPAGLDLGALGMPGCRQYLSLDASIVFLPAAGTGTTPITIPNVPAFAGISLKTQSAVLSAGVNTLGVLSSNGLRLLVNPL